MLLEGDLKLENDKVKTIFVLWPNFRKDKRGRDVEIFFVLQCELLESACAAELFKAQ